MSGLCFYNCSVEWTSSRRYTLSAFVIPVVGNCSIDSLCALVFGRTFALEIDGHSSHWLVLAGVRVDSHTGRKSISFAIKGAKGEGMNT